MNIVEGDTLTVLRTLPESSVQLVVTSPPYWGLRDYGTASWEGGQTDCDHRKTAIRQRAGVAAAANATDGGHREQSARSDNGLGLPFANECGKCGARRIDSQLGLEPLHDCLGWATGQKCAACYICRMVEVFAEVRRVLRDDGLMFINEGDSYSSQGGAHGGRSDNQYGVGAARVHEAGAGDQTARTAARGLKPKDLCGIPWRLALALQADGWYWRDVIVWHKPAPMPESVRDRCTKSWEPILMFAKSQQYYFDAAAIREPSAYPEGPHSPDAIKSPYGQGFTRAAGNWHQSQGAKGKALNNGRPELHRRRPAVTGNKPGRDDDGRACNKPGQDTRNKRNVWTLSPMPVSDAHFATFPIELPELCIRAGCPPGGLVLDPFAGSGTTGLAALKNGRDFLGIELNAKYIEIARARADRHMSLLV